MSSEIGIDSYAYAARQNTSESMEWALLTARNALGKEASTEAVATLAASAMLSLEFDRTVSCLGFLLFPDDEEES